MARLVVRSHNNSYILQIPTAKSSAFPGVDVTFLRHAPCGVGKDPRGCSRGGRAGDGYACSRSTGRTGPSQPAAVPAVAAVTKPASNAARAQVLG